MGRNQIPQRPKFLNEVRDKIRLKHDSIRMIEAGYDIRTVQERLAHKDVSTTMIYTHVLNRGGRAVRSPLDE